MKDSSKKTKLSSTNGIVTYLETIYSNFHKEKTNMYGMQ